MQEAKESRKAAKLGIESRMRLLLEKLKSTFVAGIAGTYEATIVLNIPDEALPAIEQVSKADYDSISWEVLATTNTNDQGMNDNNLIALFHGNRCQCRWLMASSSDQLQKSILPFVCASTWAIVRMNLLLATGPE